MTFDEILPAVKAGGKARRAEWARREWSCWIELVHPELPDGRALMPLLVIGRRDDVTMRPFAGSNWDLLAGDWELCSPS
jgi:hypothetical protein